MQDFLKATEGAFKGHAAWRGASEEELEASGEVGDCTAVEHSPYVYSDIKRLQHRNEPPQDDTSSTFSL